MSGTDQHRRYKVEGMFCAACAKNVENAARKIPGVTDAVVDLMRNTLEVSFNATLKDADVSRALKRNGYGSVPIRSERDLRDATRRELGRRAILLAVSAALLVILSYFAFAKMFGWPRFAGALVNMIAECVLATAIIALNFACYIQGFLGFIKLRPGMESLISLGSCISYVYSFVIMVMAGADPGFAALDPMVYFDGAAMILVMVGIGKLIESFAKERTTASLEALFSLSPETAHLRKGDGFVRVRVAELKVGDVIRVRSGESVPADGTIVEGYGWLEQSRITGEPLPVFRKTGGKVIGGTLDRSGVFLARVDALEEDSTLSRIIELVKKASLSKGKYAKLSDRVSAWLVPVILLVSLTTFLAQFFTRNDLPLALNMAVAVLVITCPCALSLATPVAMMVGAGKGAENGLLIKSAAAYEKLARIDAFAFDKTGTLTSGNIRIAEKFYYGEADPNKIRSYVVSLEANSGHPLAMTLRHYLTIDGAEVLKVDSYEDLPGRGIKGAIEGRAIVIGKADLVRDFTSGPLPEAINSFASRIYVLVDGKLSACFELIDTMKDEARAVMKELRDRGMKLYLISGDNRAASEAMGRALGIDSVFADVLPEKKADIIRHIKADGLRVAMVGDGVNDALAFKSADLAVSLGSASGLALDSADVVLMRDDLRSLLDAMRLARKVNANIKSNLFYALIYNLIGIPIAAGALYDVASHFMLNPAIAASIMALSSVSVVLNALRLKRLRFRVSDKKGKTHVETVLKIEGMGCAQCALLVKKSLMSVKGVEKAEVDLAGGTAVVTHERGIDKAVFAEAVAAAGYRVV